MKKQSELRIDDREGWKERDKKTDALTQTRTE